MKTRRQPLVVLDRSFLTPLPNFDLSPNVCPHLTESLYDVYSGPPGQFTSVTYARRTATGHALAARNNES